MPNLEVALLMRARDQASPELNKVAQMAKRSAEQTSRAAIAAQTQAQRAVRDTTAIVERATSEQTRLHQRAAAAHEQLGIRSENTIRREIQQTEAAYNRLARSGTLSAQAQARAHEAMTAKIRRLQVELNGIAVRQVGEQTRLHQRAAQAREQLGIRSENTIRREIQQTEAAYNRLSRSGTMSAQAQAQAYQAMTGKVRQLRAEMRGVEQQQNRIRGGGIGIAGAGAAIGGTALARDALSSNLRFERDLLEMKQTGEMSTAQSDQAKQKSLQVAAQNLQMPGDVLTGLRAFTSAGEKFDFAMSSIEESSRAATAYFTTAEVVAKLDVDAKQKLGIRPDQQKQMHNMLLYHGRAGRYEIGAMAQDAPKTFNTMSNAGFTGIQAVNLTGAMTQQLMKLAPATQPAEVATFMEHFFGHLTQKHYVKGLAAKGINIKKYMPGGYFGGVDKDGKPIGGDAAVRDLMAFLRVLKAKGLDDPFKLSEAGFRDMYTAKAAKQLLMNPDAIEAEMQKGKQSADSDLVGQAVTEIREANFGKIKAAEIEVEKMKLSDTATKGTGWVAENLPWLASDNPTTQMAVGGGLLWGGSKLWGAGKALASKFLPEAAAGGPSLWARAGNATQGLWTRGAAAMEGGALTRLGLGAAPLAAMAGVTQWAGDTSNDKGRTDTLKGMSDWLGQWFGKQAEFDARRNAQLEALGRKLEEPIKVEVTVINGNVVASVNKVNQIMSGRF